MKNLTNLFSLAVIATILLTSPYAVGNAFADSDDDQHEGNVNKKNRFGQEMSTITKTRQVGDLYIDSSDTDNLIIYKKTAKSTWVNIGDFQGPPGNDGAPGAQGPPGTIAAQSCPAG